METTDLQNRFSYHPPDQARVQTHENVRGVIGAAAVVLNDMLPESREKDLVITKLEEAMFWANAAIARRA